MTVINWPKISADIAKNLCNRGACGVDKYVSPRQSEKAAGIFPAVFFVFVHKPCLHEIANKKQKAKPDIGGWPIHFVILQRGLLDRRRGAGSACVAANPVSPTNISLCRNAKAFLFFVVEMCIFVL